MMLCRFCGKAVENLDGCCVDCDRPVFQRPKIEWDDNREAVMLSKDDRVQLANDLNRVVDGLSRVQSASANAENHEGCIDALIDVARSQAKIIAMLADVDTDGESFWVDAHPEEE